MATRAEEGGAARGDYSLDGSVTFSAGLTLSMIDAVAFLKRAGGSIDLPIVRERRALEANRSIQCGLDRAQQAAGLLGRQSMRFGQRVNFGRMKRLVAVDVSHSGNDALIEEQRLDLALALKQSAERGRLGFKRFRAEWSERSSHVSTASSEAPDTTEAPRVAKPKLEL